MWVPLIGLTGYVIRLYHRLLPQNKKSSNYKNIGIISVYKVIFIMFVCVKRNQLYDYNVIISN